MLTSVKKWAAYFEPENWPAIRAKGKVRFVLVSAGLWSLWMILFHILFGLVVFHYPPVRLFVIAIVFWPSCGLLFGLLMWAALEGRYRDSQATPPPKKAKK